MKFSIAPKSISALIFSRLTFIYIKNGNIVSITTIIRKFPLKSSTI